MIDATQRGVYDLVRGTATRLDSFFGTAGVEGEATVSRGRVSVGGQYDDFNGFNSRFRFKARIRLPALRERTSLIIGRGDADEFVDGSDSENIESLPGRFNDIDEDDWLFGVGYSRDRKTRRGWNFGVGARISSPIEPYVRATYRWQKNFGEKWLWRLRPRVFWQENRGTGWSLQSTLDYAPVDNWLFRSFTNGVTDDRFDGVSWTQKFIAYQSLSAKRAISYGVYSAGETGADVPIQDYGLELRLRQRISREYLFVEYLFYTSWPREELDQEREFTPGVGIEFELQFGDWPGRPQK